MSDEWKNGPQSTRRSKPVRFEENEPFLRPMTSDQLFRPESLINAEAPAYDRKLTHRQTASLRAMQSPPSQPSSFSGYAYDPGPGGYAPIPQPYPYYPQLGYMPYPPPMGGYYAAAPMGGPWQPDPYAYPQSPYGAYPQYGGQPMGMPSYPPQPNPFYPQPGYMPYPQAPVPQGAPSYPTPAAPPSMQPPSPLQGDKALDKAISPPQPQPTAGPPMEPIPKQAVLQTFPPASMPAPVLPPREEIYPEPTALVEKQTVYPTPAMQNYAADYEPEPEIQPVSSIATPSPMPTEGHTGISSHPSVDDLLLAHPELVSAAQSLTQQPYTDFAEPESPAQPAPEEEISGVMHFESMAAPPPLTPPTLLQPPFVQTQESPLSAPEAPVSALEQMVPAPVAAPIVQAVAAARPIPVQAEQALARPIPVEQTPSVLREAVAYTTPQAAFPAPALRDDWDDDDFDDNEATLQEAPQPLPVPSIPMTVEVEERGHSGFVTFLLTLTLLVSLSVVYFTGVADEFLTKVGIPAWSELSAEPGDPSDASVTPRIFSDEGETSGDDTSLALTSASGVPMLASMTVDPSKSKAPTTLIFTLESNSAVSNVRLQKSNGDLLIGDIKGRPSGDGIVWKCTIEFEEPYQGTVNAFLSDGPGEWANSLFSCEVDVQ